MSIKYIATAVAMTAIFGWLLKASANEEQFAGIFVISDITVSNDEAYERYRKAVGPVIKNCGGTYVVRAGAKFASDNSTTGLLQSFGGWKPDRIIVLNFDTVEQADACFNSPEYEAAYALQEGGASFKSITVHAFRPDE